MSNNLPSKGLWGFIASLLREGFGIELKETSGNESRSIKIIPPNRRLHHRNDPLGILDENGELKQGNYRPCPECNQTGYNPYFGVGISCIYCRGKGWIPGPKQTPRY